MANPVVYKVTTWLWRVTYSTMSDWVPVFTRLCTSVYSLQHRFRTLAISTYCRKVRAALSHLFHCIERAGTQEVGISSFQSESNPILSGHTHTHVHDPPTFCQPFTPLDLYQRLRLQEDLNTTHTKK